MSSPLIPGVMSSRIFANAVDTRSNAEDSLRDISSIQQTLMGYLVQQEEHINHLAGEALNTEENVGLANKQLRRATDRPSTARIVFWSTVGLCTWLVLWDAVY